MESVVQQVGRLLVLVLVPAEHTGPLEASFHKPRPSPSSSPPVHQGQDVEHGGHVGVVVAGRLLQVLQRLLAERHRHLVAALRRVLDHQVVERPEAGRDLVAPLLGRRLAAGLRCGAQRRGLR
ncbi:hypothetical protein EYF80_053952 [Liparis tanakae]|uniref:Uncharacterized protein n=1 Tax=Liparis tanakae TaxID=230148 RepID=A0A4Z2F406_9TELE|nr:hypothetical protein EYF80_053952 [Liparis tanakae]